jgi:GTP-binding protein
MKVTSATFIKSALLPKDYPRDGRPEVAFCGRSNVGKSTLINALLNRKGLAKTSATPGKTQTINFFEINNKIYFVDLPGYGYAKVPKTLKQQWVRHMTNYLLDRPPLRLTVALIDSRHEPSERDLEMLGLLEDAEVPTLIAATKIDKLKQGERSSNIKRIRQVLELDDEALVLPFSGVTGEGVKDLWQVIDSLIQE